MKTYPTPTIAGPSFADGFRRRGLALAVAAGCVIGTAQPGMASAHLPNKASGATAASWAETSSRVDSILDNTANILWTFTDDYFHSGDYAQSIRIDHLLFRLSPHMEQAYSIAAWLEWSSGDTPGAIRDLKKGIRANPNDYYMYSETGNCYWMWLKKPIEAIPYYIRATSFYMDAPWTDFTALAHAAEAAADQCRRSEERRELDAAIEAALNRQHASFR